MYRLDNLSENEIGSISEHRDNQRNSVASWMPEPSVNLREQIASTFPVHSIVRVSRTATIRALAEATHEASGG